MGFLDWFKKSKKRRKKKSDVIKNSFARVKRDINSVNDIIKKHRNILNKHSKKHKSHNKMFEEYNKRFESIESALKVIQKKIEAVHTRAYTPVKPFIHVHSQPDKSVNSQHKDKDFDIESFNLILKSITNKELEILHGLVQDGRKLTYKDIGIIVGINPVTVRRHFTNIKTKGFPLEEYTDENQTKRYWISKKYRKLILERQFK
ncbi:MAG: hypothetical protein ACTSQG_07085 [Promethearchaeota archaeon]